MTVEECRLKCFGKVISHVDRGVDAVEDEGRRSVDDSEDAVDAVPVLRDGRFTRFE